LRISLQGLLGSSGASSGAGTTLNLSLGLSHGWCSGSLAAAPKHRGYAALDPGAGRCLTARVAGAVDSRTNVVAARGAGVPNAHVAVASWRISLQGRLRSVSACGGRGTTVKLSMGLSHGWCSGSLAAAPKHRGYAALDPGADRCVMARTVGVVDPPTTASAAN
jgi:hypothetical protein